jgi:hypothetical protein
MRSQKVVYIVGPFRGPNAWAVEQNVRRAEELALEVWKLGAAVICPHANTRFFEGTLADHYFLEGGQTILIRCDAVITAESWQQSGGSRNEIELAECYKIPVFHTLPALAEWLLKPEEIGTGFV